MRLKAGDDLVFATGNQGKLVEARIILGGLPVRLLDLSSFPPVVEPEEIGSTFAENSRLKAEYYARLTGCWTIADDSGLEVNCLDGQPGVRSARFGGLTATYEERINLLLLAIAGSAGNDRGARFVCSITLSGPADGARISFEETCEGRIVEAPRGMNGFGYDPVFAPSGFDQTFGELPDSVKGQISHRARALALFRTYLLESLTTGA